MARIRTIKPEFFTSEDIVALSPMARLLYIALWCEADKRGRLAWKPKTFKMRWLPGDKCDITALCSELTNSGMVRLYGDDLAYIPGFEKHQHVNPRESESTLPDPDGWKDSGPRKVGKNLREAVFERDGYKCVRCSSEDNPQVDHILPQSCGGPHIIENLRTLCRSCNAARPVAGPALDEDLKKDGLTIQSLRDKFGIDASILKLHAQVGREGKGKEGKGKEGETDASDDATSPTIALIPLVDGTDFTVTEADAAEWVTAYPAVDVAQQLRSMRVWCIENTANRKTRAGIGRFIVRWLSKAQDTAPRNGQRTGPAPVVAMSPHGLQTMTNAQAAASRLFGESEEHAA